MARATRVANFMAQSDNILRAPMLDDPFPRLPTISELCQRPCTLSLSATLTHCKRGGQSLRMRGTRTPGLELQRSCYCESPDTHVVSLRLSSTRSQTPGDKEEGCAHIDIGELEAGMANLRTSKRTTEPAGCPRWQLRCKRKIFAPTITGRVHTPGTIAAFSPNSKCPGAALSPSSQLERLRCAIREPYTGTGFPMDRCDLAAL